MDVLTDDHEREEAVKKWWSEYWKPLTLGVVIALAGIVGWRQYQSWQLEQHQQQAYAVYQLQLQLQSQGTAALPQVQAYLNDNKNVFGSVLALDAAAVQINARDFAGAAESIAFVKDHGGELLQPGAVITEARLLHQSGSTEEALALLNSFKNDAYAAEAAEVRGDILLSGGDRSGARDAYRQALDLTVERGLPVSPMLQMKFDHVLNEGDSPAYLTGM